MYVCECVCVCVYRCALFSGLSFFVFLDSHYIWLSGRDYMSGFHLKTPEKFVCFIFHDRFWFVHIAFVRFKLLAHFPILKRKKEKKERKKKLEKRKEGKKESKSKLKSIIRRLGRASLIDSTGYGCIPSTL